jgi:hypothetical protein
MGTSFYHAEDDPVTEKPSPDIGDRILNVNANGRSVYLEVHEVLGTDIGGHWVVIASDLMDIALAHVKEYVIAPLQGQPSEIANLRADWIVYPHRTSEDRAAYSVLAAIPDPDPLSVALRAYEASLEAEARSHRRYVAACAMRDEAHACWQIDAAQQRVALETVQRIKAERGMSR